ncbi:MAG: hypothetical protein Q9184_001079 [Pyrenodesmia sp. 2 TL-2023]
MSSSLSKDDMSLVLSAPVTRITEEPCPANLTPPSTPLRTRHEESSASHGRMLTAQDSFDRLGMATAEVSTRRGRPSWGMTIPQACTKPYRLPDPTTFEYQEFGHGAWSTVYRAVECTQAKHSVLLTPPASPASSPVKPVISRVLAVKVAARRDAHKILHHEGRILTYLHATPEASRFLVPFHGYVNASRGLVMDAVPLSLETFGQSCLKKVRLNFSTRTMFDPVCGVPQWQSLATQLIDGLSFLHQESCVHGDIKPANVLLRPVHSDSDEAFTALYCDFSSSRILDGPTRENDVPTEQLTALTPDYASPELLASLSGSSAVATRASDVYALGVTLVAAAIGTSPYAGFSMEVQKLSIAREGRVLDLARQSDQATRIMKGRMVERCLRDALEKEVERRSTIEDWKRDVEIILKGSN